MKTFVSTHPSAFRKQILQKSPFLELPTAHNPLIRACTSLRLSSRSLNKATSSSRRQCDVSADVSFPFVRADLMRLKQRELPGADADYARIRSGRPAPSPRESSRCRMYARVTAFKFQKESQAHGNSSMSRRCSCYYAVAHVRALAARNETRRY